MKYYRFMCRVGDVLRWVALAYCYAFLVVTVPIAWIWQLIYLPAAGSNIDDFDHRLALIPKRTS